MQEVGVDERRSQDCDVQQVTPASDCCPGLQSSNSPVLEYQALLPLQQPISEVTHPLPDFHHNLLNEQTLTYPTRQELNTATPYYSDLSSSVSSSDFNPVPSRSGSNVTMLQNLCQAPLAVSTDEQILQSLPPISTFRNPLQATTSSGDMQSNLEAGSYVPDFSDLYQDTGNVWQPLYDQRDLQQPHTLGTDLEYLLERAGIYSSQQQQAGPGSNLGAYRTSQWPEQTSYESNYLDMQSKNVYAPSYHPSQAMYQSHFSGPTGQHQMSHVPIAAPAPYSYPRYPNPYVPDYMYSQTQPYMSQSYQDRSWEPSSQTQKSNCENEEAQGFKSDECLLKQYLLLPTHELDKISGVSSIAGSGRDSNVRKSRPSGVSERGSQQVRRQPRAKPTSTVTVPSNSAVTSSSVYSGPSMPTMSGFHPQQQQPQALTVHVPCCASATTSSSSSSLPPAHQTSPLYNFWSAAFARVAAASGTTVQAPYFVQGHLHLGGVNPEPEALFSKTTKSTQPRKTSSKPRASKSQGGAPRPRGGVSWRGRGMSKTVKQMLSDRELNSREPVASTSQVTLTSNEPRPQSQIPVCTPQLLTRAAFLNAQMLTSLWKVQVSPVGEVRANSAPDRTLAIQLDPPSKKPRVSSLPRSFRRPAEATVTTTTATTTTTVRNVTPAALPPFLEGKVNAKEHRPRHFEMGRLQIGNFVVLSGHNEMGKFTNKMKAVFSKRRFVYEFEALMPAPAGSSTTSGHQTGLFCVVVPFSTVTALRCDGGTIVRLMVNRQPQMFLGSRSSRRQSLVEVLGVHDTANPIDITNSQLKRSPLHVITLKPNQASNLQNHLWHFSDRFLAMSEIEIPSVPADVELPPPENEEDLPPAQDLPPANPISKGQPAATPPRPTSSGVVFPGEKTPPVRKSTTTATTPTTPVLKDLTTTSSPQKQRTDKSPTSPSRDSEDTLKLYLSPSSELSVSRPHSPSACSTSSTEIDEEYQGCSTLKEAPQVGNSVVRVTPVVKSIVAKNDDTSQDLCTTCSCRISCRSQRCVCALTQRRCRVPSQPEVILDVSTVLCLCNCCDNPLNILVSLGIDEAAAKRDMCLMQNVYKLLHLKSYLGQPVTLECCGERAPLYRFIPGVVPCPNPRCQTTLQYSWCRQLVCDANVAPPNHCDICTQCCLTDTKHCQSCGRCYNLLISTQPCPVCAARGQVRN